MGYMKANKKYILEEDEAVSAVIGVILMVAITVAIAATVYVYVSGMMGEGTRATPSITITPAASGSNCVITVASVSTSGIDWADVSYTLVNRTDAEQWTIANDWGASITLPTATTATGGQIITITGDALDSGNEYAFTLIYDQTGGTMGTITWRQ